MSIQPRSVVTVFVRHRESCSHASRGEFYQGCQCSKFLRYSRNGRQHRQAAGTRMWSIAEDKATELLRLFSCSKRRDSVLPPKPRRATMRIGRSSRGQTSQRDIGGEPSIRKHNVV